MTARLAAALVCATVLGVPALASAATCTVSGTVDIRPMDVYYCDTDGCISHFAGLKALQRKAFSGADG